MMLAAALALADALPSAAVALVAIEGIAAALVITLLGAIELRRRI